MTTEQLGCGPYWNTTRLEGDALRKAVEKAEQGGMTHVEQIPYDDTTRESAETVHLIRFQNRRRLAQLNQADDARAEIEANAILRRALQLIRPRQLA